MLKQKYPNKCFKNDKLMCYLATALIIGSVIATFIVVFNADSPDIKSSWGYQCQNDKCVRIRIESSNSTARSLAICHLTCVDGGTMWPKPTGSIFIDKVLYNVDLEGFILEGPKSKAQKEFWIASRERFRDLLDAKLPERSYLKRGGRKLLINIQLESDSLDFDRNTIESYRVRITSTDKQKITVEIIAPNYFGARHGLETLSQLIIFDEFSKKYWIPKDIYVEDAPVYKHRGILMDTSRSFYSISSIKRTINTMAMVKLNVFHWHITDSQSFAMQLKSLPELSKAGAYEYDKIYSANDIKEIVRYGKVRGVRIVPEFDAPAHVGEGWQVFPELITCFNYQPWNRYCVGPPCGQLDPSKVKLYDVLESIYEDMVDIFQQPDLFHMGGDEVKPSCWNVSSELQNWMIKEKGWSLETDDFMELWGYFQEKAYERLMKVGPKEMKAVLWTSTLTDDKFIDKFIDKNNYIIQIWTTGKDPTVRKLLERGYELIMSNHDALYLDCGFGLWVADGNNWCSPYKPWHAVYNNNLRNLAGEYQSQILGGEVCLWSSINDEQTLDSRVWPRASALAERLWAEPEETYRWAETRILYHRENLVENGIGAESIQPMWCLQNEGQCPQR